jgi:radical SAM superfamily enzyme YgiQ (UPF0313 family)
MHSTLIFPGVALPGFDSFARKPTVDANFIDHGLASISAAAKARGHTTDLIDLRTLRDWDHFRAEVRRRPTRVWAVTSWSLHYPDAVRAIRVVKEEHEDAIVVLGGVHATLQTPQVLANRLVDHVVTREGELAFAALLDDVEAGEAVPRLVVGEGGDLDALPWVDRDLFDPRGELAVPMAPGLPTPFVTTNAGRGCPFRCNFCQPAERAVFGNKVKMRSPENVVAELLHLRERFGFRSWMAHDDLFFINPKWMRAFCAAYRAAGLDQPFICQMRADLIRRFPDVVAEMAAAGLAWGMIGFESGSQRILDFLEKDTTVEENVRAADVLRAHGVRIWANVMFGVPTETRAEVLETVRMVWRIRPDHLSASYFTPTPGSNIAGEVERRGLAVVDPYAGSCRSPTEAKVRGVDYAWLAHAIAAAHADRSDDLLRTLAALPAASEASCG